MTRSQLKAGGWGLATAGLLGVGIFVGSNNLRHIDAALVGYTFACLFAAFGLGYRYSMWLQRPPTRMYWKRGWQSFFRPGHIWGSLKALVSRFVGVILLNRFIWRRNKARGVAHLLIMWGCLMAAAITFPLVYGWVFFETVPGDLSRYRTFAFGLPVFDFAHESLIGHLLFHGLVWSSFLVIAGVLLALHRRFKDHGAAAPPEHAGRHPAAVHAVRRQRDRAAADGQLHLDEGVRLRIPGDHPRRHGHRPAPVAAVRQVLPHLPAAGPARGQVLPGRWWGGRAAQCARCLQPFASRMHVEDLITVEAEMGYRYDMPGHPAGHYQHVCPACRRKMFALAQAGLSPSARDEGVTADGR